MALDEKPSRPVGHDLDAVQLRVDRLAEWTIAMAPVGFKRTLLNLHLRRVGSMVHGGYH
jgi:hypothetical protein